MEIKMTWQDRYKKEENKQYTTLHYWEQERIYNNIFDEPEEEDNTDNIPEIIFCVGILIHLFGFLMGLSFVLMDNLIGAKIFLIIGFIGFIVTILTIFLGINDIF
jgi:hypothetical protein